MAKVLNMSSFKQNNRESAMQSKMFPDYGKYIRACSFGILFEELHRQLVSLLFGCDFKVPEPKVCPSCEYIRYSADGYAELDGEFVLIELKTPYKRYIQPTSIIPNDYRIQVQCGLMVYPEVKKCVYSELGLYVLQGVDGDVLRIEKPMYGIGDSYKSNIYTIKIHIKYFNPKFVPNINVIFHPLNGDVSETLFDEVLSLLTKGGVSVPYTTYLHPEPNTDEDSVYIYVAKYELNIVEEKMRDYGLQQKMVRESTKFIKELEERKKKIDSDK
jgi:hypothetical protein